jgi:hypothetical protein
METAYFMTSYFRMASLMAILNRITFTYMSKEKTCPYTVYYANFTDSAEVLQRN